MAYLDPAIHAAWLASSAQGQPPRPELVAREQYHLAVNWHHREAFLDLPSRINPSSPSKSLVCREASRGSGKSTLVAFTRLYLCEYVLPFLSRPGLPIREENRNYIIFGRDQNHLRDDIITPLKSLILTCSPWLRTKSWLDIVESWEDPDNEGLRELSEMKSKGSQKWESFRIDLDNGVSIRTRTLKQSIRAAHVFVADMDDPLTEKNVSESTNIRALIQGAILPALEPGGLFLLDGCLAGDSDVLMADGTPRKINDVNVGEMVWAIDETGSHGARKVVAKIPQGEKQTFTVTTDIGTIRATENHPLLTVRDGDLQWVRVDALSKGDLVVSARKMPGDNSEHPWMTESMAWFLGFIMGDGWLSDGGAIGIAISRDEEANKKIEDAWRDCWPFIAFQTVPFGGKSGGGYIRGHHKPTVDFLKSIGLGGRAKTKRIPEWLFRMSPEVKIAFLRGLCDADGRRSSKAHDLEVIELANPPLVLDIRNLALTCGVKPGIVRERTRNIRLPSTGRLATSHTASVSLNFALASRILFGGRSKIGTKRQQSAVEATKKIGPNFRLSRIKSIAPFGIEQVYDLTVEGSRAFIANGLAVHNTPQAPGDLFDQCRDDPDWDYQAHPAYDADGTLGYAARNAAHLGPLFAALSPEDRHCLWPQRLPFIALEQARGKTVESETKYLREYLLKRITDNTSLVHPDDLLHSRDFTSSYHHHFTEGCIYHGGLDPSGRKRDDAGFALGYVTKDGTRHLAKITKLIANPHLPDGEGEMSVIREANELSRIYHCYDWTVEGNGFQGIVAPLLRALNPSIRMKKFNLGSNKHTEQGWLGLRTTFRSRQIKFPYQTQEDRAITDEVFDQIRGLQYIEGKVTEDPRRRNDLASAVFLFLKSTELSEPVYSVSTLPLRATQKEPEQLHPSNEVGPPYHRRLSIIGPSVQASLARVSRWKR